MCLSPVLRPLLYIYNLQISNLFDQTGLIELTFVDSQLWQESRWRSWRPKLFSDNLLIIKRVRNSGQLFCSLTSCTVQFPLTANGQKIPYKLLWAFFNIIWRLYCGLNCSLETAVILNWTSLQNRQTICSASSRHLLLHVFLVSL